MAEVFLRWRFPPGKALVWASDESYWRFLWANRGATRSNARVHYSPTLGWRPVPRFRSPHFSLNSRGVRGNKGVSV